MKLKGSLKVGMVAAALAVSLFALPAAAASTTGDWLQYRGDAGHSGFTTDNLSSRLSLVWRNDGETPNPAWTGAHTRMIFDYAYEPVVSGNTLFYGSSVDCKVYALDASSGAEKWAFTTDAPVRFAPAIYNDKVYATSDDGSLYCISAADGSLIWKKGAPASDLRLGNDRMVSRWPSRGGVVIDNGVLYYGVGIWPTDEIYVYAVNPETGKAIWTADKYGSMFWDQPHGTAQSESGISAQGYMTISGDKLLVPTGRAVPAGLDKATGELKYFHLQLYRDMGGSLLFANDKYFFSVSGNSRYEDEVIGKQQAIFNNTDGKMATGQELYSPSLVITPDKLYQVDSGDWTLKAYNVNPLIDAKKEKDAKGNTITKNYLSQPVWSMKALESSHAMSMIMAGDKLITGTENKKVSVYDVNKGSRVWSTEVDGIPYALAVAHGKLYVSTDKGTIYCFGETKATPVVHPKKAQGYPYDENASLASIADEIVKTSGITEGYCLDAGCLDGALTYELAMRTNLHIVAIDHDANNVASARKKLSEAGLYGTRVTVLQGGSDLANLPSYFANLVVSSRSILNGDDSIKASALNRIVRPYGGVLMMKQAGALTKTVRGALEGAGEWTHLYADPANTLSSGDKLVKGDLGMLWWNDPNFDSPSRHGRGVGPLFKDGILIAEGVDDIRAYDAYNGRELWRLYLEYIGKPYDQDTLSIGVNATGGNMAISGNRLYVKVGEQSTSSFRFCLAVDIYTGKIVAEYQTPEFPKTDMNRSYLNPGPRWNYLPDYPAVFAPHAKWSYLGVVGNTIFGSFANLSHVVQDKGWSYTGDSSNTFTESSGLFAMDAITGKLKWVHTAEDSIRNNTIAIGSNAVYFIDRKVAQQDKYGVNTVDHPYGKLVALDVQTGKKLYENAKDEIYGTVLSLSEKDELLLMTYNFSRFTLPSEVGGRMTGFNPVDGSVKWDTKINIGKTAVKEDPETFPLALVSNGTVYRYSSRPVFTADTIFFEPYTFDKKTGKQLEATFDRSYNCGIICSSDSMLIYRSGCLGYTDLEQWEVGTQNWGGFRPACWVNTIPAGGVVLVPQSIEDCDCSYLMLASMALHPIEKNQSIKSMTDKPTEDPKVFKCPVCAYIYEGNDPPDVCPICGVSMK